MFLIFKLLAIGIKACIDKQISDDKEIFNLLATIIDHELSEAASKIWHAHPVWFLDGNPIVGFSKQKAGWRLIFWSGADFEENDLNGRGKNLKMHRFFILTLIK